MTSSIRLVLFALAWAALGALLSAQSAAPAAAFDVVSIRLNTSGTTQQAVAARPDGLTFINFQLRPIIQFAYGISHPSRLIGLPAWAEDRYDVIATTAPGAPPPTATIAGMQPHVRALLADRFKLVARLEQRELPAYSLVLARRDGTLGPGLKPSTAVCAGSNGAPPTRGPAAPADAPPVLCGIRPGGPGRFVAIGSTVSVLTGLVSLPAGRTIIDRTGLTQLYDLELRFSDGGPATADYASLFTAVEEQLGLKLDPARELIDVLVIDRLDRPAEN